MIKFMQMKFGMQICKTVILCFSGNDHTKPSQTISKNVKIEFQTRWGKPHL